MPVTVDVCSVEGGYRADGHVDREVFVGCLLEEYNKVASPDHVLHVYERFVPIRGERDCGRVVRRVAARLLDVRQARARRARLHLD